MTYFKENRRARRSPSGEAVKICWNDGGGYGVVHAICLDTSEGGLGIVSREPLPKQTAVLVRLHPGQPVRYASIRHSLQHSSAYFSGLQFTGIPPVQSADSTGTAQVVDRF